MGDKKLNLALLCILLLAIIFRFFRMSDLSYWSVDEEIMVAVTRKIAVEGKLLLVTPNEAIATSLGPFFHYFAASVFRLANFNPLNIVAVGSILGVATTTLIIYTGKTLFNLRTGLIAGFLYAISFLASLSDRRFWTLSLNPFLATLAILSLAKLKSGDYRYLLALAFSVSFAWHSDPSLAVLIVFSILGIIFFRPRLWSKTSLPALVYLILSVVPTFLFEVRHPGAITHPIGQLLLRPVSYAPLLGSAPRYGTDPLFVVQGLARSLSASPSLHVEEYFCYCGHYPAPLFSPLPELFTVGVFVFALVLAIRNKKIRGQFTMLFLFFLAFIFGILFFGSIFRANIHLHYFTIVWPAFFLLLALCLNLILSKGYRLLVAIILLAILGLNLYSLLFSRMRYPLGQKSAVADWVVSKVWPKPFALYSSSPNRYLEGFGGLFLLKNAYPQNQSYYQAWDWIYRAYSLYPIPMGIKPKAIVTITPTDWKGKPAGDSEFSSGSVHAVISYEK